MTASTEKPTLFVCHGDNGGPRTHPCRRVQEAMRAAGIEYNKVLAAHGSPIPFLRKGSREELREATGATNLPALELPDGTVISHSRAILSWVSNRSDLTTPPPREAGARARPRTAPPLLPVSGRHLRRTVRHFRGFSS